MLLQPAAAEVRFLYNYRNTQRIGEYDERTGPRVLSQDKWRPKRECRERQ